MQASLPSGSASTQNAGAAASLSSRAARGQRGLKRGPAPASCGTETSMWMRLRCGRGASICWNHTAGPWPAGSTMACGDSSA